MHYDVRLDWAADRASTRACPLCGAPGPHGQKVRVEIAAAPLPQTDIFHCGTCQGVFADPFKYPDYGENYGFKDYLRYYLELGGGFESMAHPLERALAIRPVKTVLDVGCGVPIMGDFLKRQYEVEAIALDPSDYAMEGGKALNVRVISGQLEDNALGGAVFDIVFASEVIEHVVEPRDFLDQLIRHLSPDGILVMTTPDADALGPQTDTIGNLAITWPGIHHACFSKEGLEQALGGAGLTYFSVEREGATLIAYASRAAFNLPAPQESRLGDYLSGAFPELPAFNRGNLFRRFRTAVGTGKWDSAARMARSLRRRIHADYKVDILDSAAIAEHFSTKPAETAFDDYPYFAPLLPFHLAMVDFQGPDRDLDRALAALQAQIDICEQFHGGQSLNWGEIAHIYEPSRLNLGMVHLMKKDWASASEALADYSPPEGSLAAMGRRDPVVGLIAKSQGAYALARMGRLEEADAQLAGVRENAQALADPAMITGLADIIELQIQPLR